MKIVIDTNRYRDFCENIPKAVTEFRRAEEIHMPFVVLAELRSGFLCGTSAVKNEATLHKFLNRARVHILFPDEVTTHHYARIFRQLRAQGTPIPTNNMWIAALVSQYGYYLFSRDVHFNHLPQLPTIIY